MSIDNFISKLTAVDNPNPDVDALLLKIEKLLNYRLPVEYKEFYKKCDGGLLSGNNILRISDVLSELIEMKNLNVENDFYGDTIPENAIVKKCYTTDRLPFFSDFSGNFVGIDFGPGATGVPGQIINFGGDESVLCVFANTFIDFVNGLENIDIPQNAYITDYLLNNNLNFIKELDSSKFPKKLNKPTLNKTVLKVDNVQESTFDIAFEYSMIGPVNEILDETIRNIKKDINIVSYTIRNRDYRIKNIKDSRSRTMSTLKAFVEKLQDYPKDEIRGFTFLISLILEEQTNETTSVTDDASITVDFEKTKVYIKLRDRANNKIMIDTYNKLCELFK